MPGSLYQGPDRDPDSRSVSVSPGGGGRGAPTTGAPQPAYGPQEPCQGGWTPAFTPSSAIPSATAQRLSPQARPVVLPLRQASGQHAPTWLQPSCCTPAWGSPAHPASQLPPRLPPSALVAYPAPTCLSQPLGHTLRQQLVPVCPECPSICPSNCPPTFTAPTDAEASQVGFTSHQVEVLRVSLIPLKLGTVYHLYPTFGASTKHLRAERYRTIPPRV